MTTVSTDVIKAVTPSVWVMRSDGDVFVWNWSSWIRTSRLIPQQATTLPGAMGSAQFRLLRETRLEPGRTSYRTVTSFVTERAYIAIADGDGLTTDRTELDPAKVLWFGYVDRIREATVLDTDDTFGSVDALEVGHLLDAIQPQGWVQEGAVDGTTEQLDAPPSANFGGGSGAVVGNAVVVTDGGISNQVFARLVDDCAVDGSTLWSRYGLLQHALTYCTPPALPALGLNLPAAVETYLEDTSTAEVFGFLRNATWKGLLDLILPASRALGWSIDIGRAEWTIRVYSLSDDGAFGLPPAPSIDIDGTGIILAEAPRLERTAVQRPDEIIVEGEQILFGVSIDRESFGADWTAAAQTAYEAALRTTDANAITQPQFEGVFSSFRLELDGQRELTRSSAPGDGGERLPLCPLIDWSGTVASVDYSTNRSPNLPTASLARTIPWEEGRPHPLEGTDNRDAKQKANPQWMRPLLFLHDAVDLPHWAMLTQQGDNPDLKLQGLSLDVGDLGATFTVRASPPHEIGLGTIDPLVADAAIDWRGFVLTLGVWGDQRLSITKRRPGCSEFQVVRRLVVRVPEFQCWVMTQGSLLGLSADGSPLRLPLDVFARNDFPAAERFANQLAAYHFRERRTLVLSFLGGDFDRAQYTLGTMVTSYTDGVEIIPVATPISSVAYDWSESAVRVTVATDLPTAPSPILSGAGAASPSPSAGGQVSVAAGGTTAQAAAAANQKVDELARDLARVPLVVPRPPSRDPVRYARIAWRVGPTGPGAAEFENNSVGQLINRDGTDLSGDARVVWIGQDARSPSAGDEDTLVEGQAVIYGGIATPHLGDGAVYEIELVADEHDRNGTVRPLYRVVRHIAGGVIPRLALPTAPIIGADPFPPFPSNSDWFADLYDQDVFPITTTIDGAELTNQGWIRDAFAGTDAAAKQIPLAGLVVNDRWLTERYFQRIGDLPAGLEDGVTAPAIGQVPVCRLVGGVKRWKFEAPGAGGLPSGSARNFLRLASDGTTVQWESLGALEFTGGVLKTDDGVTSNGFQVGSTARPADLTVSGGAILGAGSTGLQINYSALKFATIKESATDIAFVDDATTALLWRVGPTSADRSFDFNVPINIKSGSLVDLASGTSVVLRPGSTLSIDPAATQAEIRPGTNRVEFFSGATPADLEWITNSGTDRFVFNIEPHLAQAVPLRFDVTSSSFQLLASGSTFQFIDNAAATVYSYSSGTGILTLSKALTATAAVSISGAFDVNSAGSKVLEVSGGVKFGAFGVTPVVQQTVGSYFTTTVTGTPSSGGFAVLSNADSAIISALVTEVNKIGPRVEQLCVAIRALGWGA